MSQLTLRVTGIAIDGVVKLLTVTTADSARATATSSASAHSGALPRKAPPYMALINFLGLVLVQCLSLALF
jgi:hypothetical protein